jgi:hypothetical protein
MIPFETILVAIWTNDAISRCDFVPSLSLRTTGATNAMHVHSEPIGMK